MSVQNASVDEHVFVNRFDELEFLEALVTPSSVPSSLVIVRAPTGYGKSSVTSELMRRRDRDLAAIVVDPLIRTSPGGAPIYDGFFIQRCAEEFSVRAQGLGREAETFRGFLSGKRWRLVSHKNPVRELRELPGMKLGYSMAVEYSERFFARGRFAPANLLASDSREAISLCRDYVEYACGLGPSLIVVREGQHIDHESLRSLLQLNRRCARQHMILEYTAERRDFEASHSKVIHGELLGHPNAHIIDLAPLRRPEFEHLLARLGVDEAWLNADFYASWNGNLRLLSELRFEVGFARRLQTPVTLDFKIPDLGRQMGDHLSRLTSTQKWLLALVAAHVEPIARRTLFETALIRARHATEADLKEDFASLVEVHHFVDAHHDQVSLAHDDVATAICEAPVMAGLIALAEAALRDHYAGLVEKGAFTTVSMTTATRRLFAFCAKTREIALLIRLIESIDVQIRNANDQTIYVDLAVEAIRETETLLPAERRRLVDWAGFLAYEVCDVRRTIELFEAHPDPGFTQKGVLAHAFIECGEHERAATIAAGLRREPEDDARLLADLIDAGIALDSGRWTECAAVLRQLTSQGAARKSPLVGHAYRLLAEIEDYPDCTATALVSVDWFKSLDLTKCAAYSALSASRFLARTGQIKEAMILVDEASAALESCVRDQHLVLNDRALVGLLADSPDYHRCAEWLQQALRTSRDDFSDLTILCNLSVAHWQRGAMEDALECAARCVAILDEPGFAERDVFWPVCFNIAQVLKASGDGEAATAVLKRPKQTGWKQRTSSRYWSYRFGETDTPDPAMAHVLRFDYYPIALSHWHVDLEALVQPTPGVRG